LTADRFEVRTERLRLIAATADELRAMNDRDRVRFETLLGARAPVEFVPPPETADVLDWFRTAIEEDPGIRPWFFRWVVDHEAGVLVGSVGFAGYPNDECAVLLGYSVYPEFEGRGYASEAARRMTEWALVQPGVNAVKATIFPDHPASQRVAANAGLAFVRELETDDGTVGLWERRAPG
jgi:RimJ/RimL family protein N-acetyltransferase